MWLQWSPSLPCTSSKSVCLWVSHPEHSSPFNHPSGFAPSASLLPSLRLSFHRPLIWMTDSSVRNKVHMTGVSWDQRLSQQKSENLRTLSLSPILTSLVLSWIGWGGQLHITWLPSWGCIQDVYTFVIGLLSYNLTVRSTSKEHTVHGNKCHTQCVTLKQALKKT